MVANQNKPACQPIDTPLHSVPIVQPIHPETVCSLPSETVRPPPSHPQRSESVHPLPSEIVRPPPSHPQRSESVHPLPSEIVRPPPSHSESVHPPTL